MRREDGWPEFVTQPAQPVARMGVAFFCVTRPNRHKAHVLTRMYVQLGQANGTEPLVPVSATTPKEYSSRTRDTLMSVHVSMGVESTPLKTPFEDA